MLKPIIDVLKLGSDDDPCFGKLWDPKEKECRNCGESEICAIVKSQGLKIIREEIERDTRFLDLEEAEIIDLPDIREFIRSKRNKKIDDDVIIRRASRRFNKTPEEIEEIIKTI